MSKEHTYTKEYVTSKDSTTIGYRQMGSGPGIILLHGGINASQHLMKLGTLLSDDFTVYIPDRRGRGLSGPIGEDYSIEKEDEDLNALLKKTGAHYVFGTADGALFALHAAISLQNIHKVAAYEPLIFTGQPGEKEFRTTIQKLDKNLAEGKLAKATVDLIKDSPKGSKIPNFLYIPIIKLFFWINIKTVKGDDVSYQELIPPLADELHVVENTKGTLDDYKNVSAKVLLLEGSKTDPLLRDSVNALNKILPNSNLIELKSLNHDSAQDYGKPEPIALELKRFFE
jgi:pimeloyl-ACP methyl ester carboxylesterase